MKRRILATAVLFALAASSGKAQGADVHMACASVRGGGTSGCEVSVERSFDFALPIFFTDKMTWHVVPVIRFTPSVLGVSFADEGFGKTFFFREAFVEKIWSEVGMTAGIKKVSDPIVFDFVSFMPGKKADGRNPFATLKEENALGTPGVYANAKIAGEWTLDVGIIASPAGTSPGKTGQWTIPLPQGFTLGEPENGKGGVIGALYGKIADVKVAVTAGNASSNTATRIIVSQTLDGGVLARPLFGRQDVFAFSAEKSLGENVTVRIGGARHEGDEGLFTRGGVEVQKVWEWPNKTDLYTSCGFFGVRQKEGSSVDLNRALTNHGACRIEYKEGKFVYGATFVRGLDRSGYVQGELRYDVQTLAKLLGVKDAELSIQASAVNGGDNDGTTNIFQTYAGRKTATITFSFGF